MLDYFQYEKFVSYELPILMLLSLEGMFLIVSANDYFVMYVALELQSIPLYILATSKRYSNVSVEAGLKYFIYGSFASGMILYGISLIYGSVGVTDFSNINIL
jgi:NADH-quinone oxidoreductase subunit N